MMLGAALSCGNTEEAATPATPAPPGIQPGLQPHQRPELEKMPPKETPKASETPKPDESKKEEPPKVEGPKSEVPKTGAAAVTLTTDELAAIKELPAAEQDQAIKQAVCPVSDEPLGSMGKPVKVTAEGQTFYLCCDHCKDDLAKDPKAVLAKLSGKK